MREEYDMCFAYYYRRCRRPRTFIFQTKREYKCLDMYEIVPQGSVRKK